MDFFIFYISSLYIGKRGTLYWDTPVRRAVSVIGIIMSLWALSIAQIVFFLLFKKDFWESNFIVPILIVGGIAVIQLLRYVYIGKKRYEHIQGTAYRAFTMSRNAAITICTAMVFLSVLLPFGVGIIIVELTR